MSLRIHLEKLTNYSRHCLPLNRVRKTSLSFLTLARASIWANFRPHLRPEDFDLSLELDVELGITPISRSLVSQGSACLEEWRL